MPAPFIDLPSATDPPRKRWTREEYHRLPPEVVNCEAMELIDGELISKAGKPRRHVVVLAMLRIWLAEVFGPFSVETNVPIDVAPEDVRTNEPEPDIIVLLHDTFAYPEAKPGPADLRLLSEVADAVTLGFDLTAKARLYARAGIQDYWVLDVEKRRLIVHRRPSQGRYESVIAYAENEPVSPLASAGSELRVADLFRK
jgi:Uma2 family endonuclease